MRLLHFFSTFKKIHWTIKQSKGIKCSLWLLQSSYCYLKLRHFYWKKRERVIPTPSYFNESKSFFKLEEKNVFLISNRKNRSPPARSIILLSTAMNVIDNSYLWNSVRTTFASALAQLATQFVQNDQFKCATLVYSLFAN